MSAWNPILGTQRHFRWKQEENGYVHENVSWQPSFRNTNMLHKAQIIDISGYLKTKDIFLY